VLHHVAKGVLLTPPPEHTGGEHTVVGEPHCDRFTIGEDQGGFDKLFLRPVFAGVFVVGDAADAVVLPQLFENARTVAFALFVVIHSFLEPGLLIGWYSFWKKLGRMSSGR